MEKNKKTKMETQTKKSIFQLILIILAVIVFVSISTFLVVKFVGKPIDEKTNVEIESKTKSSVELGEYKGMEVEYEPLSFSEDEYNSYIQNARIATKDYEEVKVGTIEIGDVVVVTYNGWLKENTALENEEQEYDTNLSMLNEFELTIGSNIYIPGFEDALIGKNIGETTKIEIPFPEDYGNEDYNGKVAIFEVNLISKRIYEESPSDEKVLENLVPLYFQDSTETKFKTFDEFKVWLKNDMETYYRKINNQEKENAAIKKYISLAKNFSIDEQEEELSRQEIIESYKKEAEQYQIDIETLANSYYGFVATDEKTAFDVMVENSLKSKLEYDIVLSTLIEKENIKLEENDVDAYVESLANSYSISSEEVMSAYIYEENGEKIDNYELLEKEALYGKAIQLLVENAKFIELSTN